MRNNKKKPSVFKNILVITGCTMFAALYAVTVLYILSGVFGMSFYVRSFGSFARGGMEKSQSDEKESLPAWVDRVEIELETQTDNWGTKDQESADTIEQEPRFDADADKADERESIENRKRMKKRQRRRRSVIQHSRKQMRTRQQSPKGNRKKTRR